MLLAALAIITFSGSVSNAQDSLLISYQGRLTDDAGAPITGSHAMTFTIYNAGGSAIWTESHSGVPISDGLVLVVLGSETSLLTAIFDGEHRYLGIRINGGEEIVPRTLLTSSPGAAVARRVVGDVTTAPGLLQLHPLDPCVPPEPCDPAIELIADTEIHSLKIFPPDPASSTSAAVIMVGADGAKIGIATASPTEALEIASGGQVVASVSSAGVWTGAGSGLTNVDADLLGGTPASEYVTGTQLTQQLSDYAQLGGGATFQPTQPDVVPVAIQAAVGQIANLQEWKDNLGSTVIAVTPDGVLDVNGTAEVEGFKMTTAASDGHVLTSDGDGNGTWQAPSGGGDKAACADMYDGSTNASSQITITFPVTFDVPPHFSVTGLIMSGAHAGKTAYIPKPTPGTTSVTVTVQYWSGAIFMDLGSGEDVMLSYTAIEK
jgi:hypothetical protein